MKGDVTIQKLIAQDYAHATELKSSPALQPEVIIRPKSNKSLTSKKSIEMLTFIN